jgi:hypothetical protein
MVVLHQELFSFKDVERSKEQISGHAGLIMLDGFMKSLKIEEIVDEQMPAPGSNRGYEGWEYIEPLILMQYGGGRNICDVKEVREDAVLRQAIGMQTVPSDSAIGDWLLRMGKGEGLKGVKKVESEVAKKLIRLDKTEEYTMFADPTIIDLGDKQDAPMTYTGVKGDRPILVGLKELPIFVHADYRQGNAMGGAAEAVKSSYEIVEGCGKKVSHFAGDSEFYVSELIKFLSSKGITFTIVADNNKAVKEVIEQIPQEEWRPYVTKDGVKTDREIATSVHAMEQTEAFTLVVLRWKKEESRQLKLVESDEYFYHAIATDLKLEAEQVIEKHEKSMPPKEEVAEGCKGVWKYNERVQMENMIKELKIGIGMEHMPCGEFEANAMYFAIGVLTYNLMIALKYFVIQEGYETKTIGTLRWALIQIPAKLIKTGRQVILKIATTVDKFNHYLRMLKRIQAVAAQPG